MYIAQEIPVIQNKIIYFVGASDLEMITRKEINDLTIALKGFVFSLKKQQSLIDKFSKEKIELFYNTIYQTLENFIKINKKIMFYKYFNNKEIQILFAEIIKILKEIRKVLLIKIEGKLLSGTIQITQKNIMKRYLNNQ